MNKFNYNIIKIDLYPFGGIIITNEEIDKSLKEEIIITIMGPLFQIMFFLVIFILYKNNYVTEYLYNLYTNYNLSIICFNLLPIVPLDGSKILNILLNKIFNFRLSYNINIVISVIFLALFFLIFKKDTSYYIIIIFLIYQILYFIKNKYYIFNKFILEKKLKRSSYIKYKKVDNIKKMYRNKRNLIKDDYGYVTEYKYINKK